MNHQGQQSNDGDTSCFFCFFFVFLFFLMKEMRRMEEKLYQAKEERKGKRKGKKREREREKKRKKEKEKDLHGRNTFDRRNHKNLFSQIPIKTKIFESRNRRKGGLIRGKPPK